MNSYFEVLTTLISRGPLAKRELAELLGLSAPSLTRIVKYWVNAGCLEVRPTNNNYPELNGVGPRPLNNATAGRPVEPVFLRPDCAHFVGVNLRGEGVSSVLMNAGGEILNSHELRLTDHSPTAVAKQIGQSITALMSSHCLKPAGANISLGGALDDQFLVQRAPFLNWRQVNFLPLVKEEIQPILPDIPLGLSNDVEALTNFELLYGAGKEDDNFALLTFGAGIGHGMAHERRVITIPAQGIGYIGHLPVANGWGICHRGHQSCTSAVVTLSGLRALLPPELPAVPQLDPTQATLNEQALKQIVQAYLGGDQTVQKAVDRYIETSGQLISTVAAVSMTNLLAIAGESVDIFALNLDLLHSGAAQYRNPTLPELKLELRSSDFRLWAQGAATVAALNYFAELS